jgi:hypothetical protein
MPTSCLSPTAADGRVRFYDELADTWPWRGDRNHVEVSFLERPRMGSPGHNRLFAKGSLLASHLTMRLQLLTKL